jgi:1-acyl-sn-glycerol-3-phosphate acyltransferase
MTSKLALFLLHLLGWELIGERPPYRKYVLVGAPHTSNWDFLYFYLGALGMGLKVSFMAKDSLFKGPLGFILRKMGGIPVIRSRHTNMVQQMIKAFEERDDLILLVPP